MDGDADKPLFFRLDRVIALMGSTGVRTTRTAQEKSEFMESYGCENGRDVTRPYGAYARTGYCRFR